jgi:hypothetical protein
MLITDGVGFATLQPPHFPGTDSSMAKDVRKFESQVTPRKYPAAYLFSVNLSSRRYEGLAKCRERSHMHAEERAGGTDVDFTRAGMSEKSSITRADKEIRKADD